MKRQFDAACRQYEVKASKGKNLFDLSQIHAQPSSNSTAWISEVGADYLIISEPSGYTANGGVDFGKTLRQLAPGLVVGKTYRLNFDTETDRSTGFYLAGLGDDAWWRRATSRQVTDAMLDAYVRIYGKNVSGGDTAGDCRISNIQIEEGNAATEYVPYGLNGFAKWSDGLKSGFPSVKLLGKTTQAATPTLDEPQEVLANNATVRSGGKNLLNLDLDAFNAAPIWGVEPTKNSVFQSALSGIQFKPNRQYTISAETQLAPNSDSVHYIRFDYTDGSRSAYGGYELADSRYGIEGRRTIKSAIGKTISHIAIESGYGGQFETFWMQLEESPTATDYEPYFDGGEATAPNLMCAVDGSCQSTYDSQTGEFVNWWWDKITLNGSERWGQSSHTAYGRVSYGFCALDILPEEMSDRACWCNQSPPQAKHGYDKTGSYLSCGSNNKTLYAFNFGFYDETLPDKGVSNWKAHLAEHPLEVWVARNEPEITNIGPQRLTCPTGYGQIVQVAGDIPDCPLEIKYLSHGGNVKIG